MEFAIVDIETAGGAPKGGGITEIAVLIHDGERIVEEFQTLLNPEQGIPTYITGLTGIDNFMVRHEPTFSQIQDKLWNLLDGRVFVAHQVNFDFSFIRESFLREGRDFKAAKLCTVKLSRKVFPGLGSYSLGRLCESQKIPITARHRAMGDARATAILFDRMIKIQPATINQSLRKNTGESFLPPNFPFGRFKEIPQACGVYYMLDEHKKVIYVGKANNIRERFKNHFSGQILPHLKQKLKAEVVDLKWELMGTEFLSLLYESLEIRRLWPKYNSAFKIPKILWGLFHYEDGKGYGRFQISKVTKNLRPLETFFSLEEANQFLKTGIELYGLCPKLSGMRKVTCSEDDEFNCKGACLATEDPSAYNLRISDFLDKIKEGNKEILIQLPGRDQEENAWCLFERGILSKYGFFNQSLEEVEIHEKLQIVPKVPETYYILRQFIHQLNPGQIRVLEKA